MGMDLIARGMAEEIGARTEDITSELFGADGATIPSCRVYNSTNQSISNSNFTTQFVVFDSELFDTDNIHDTTIEPSRLTCKTAGKYFISANIRFASNNVGYRRCDIILNAANTIAASTAIFVTGDATQMNASTIWNLDVGDYVRVRVGQTSGASLNIEKDTLATNHFMMVKVG